MWFLPKMWGVSNYFSILQCNRPVSDSKIVRLHLKHFISAHLITLHRSLTMSHDLEMRSWEELRSFLCMKDERVMWATTVELGVAKGAALPKD